MMIRSSHDVAPSGQMANDNYLFGQIENVDFTDADDNRSFVERTDKASGQRLLRFTGNVAQAIHTSMVLLPYRLFYFGKNS